MKHLISSILVLIFLTGISTYVGCTSEQPQTPLKEKSIYEFSMKGIDGKEVKMEDFKGKVLLVVNVASL